MVLGEVLGGFGIGVASCHRGLAWTLEQDLRAKVIPGAVVSARMSDHVAYSLCLFRSIVVEYVLHMTLVYEV